MTTPNYSVIFSAQLVGSSTVSVGQVLIPSAAGSSQYAVATSAIRGTRRAEGIALTAFSGANTGSVQLQQSGTIDATISGIGAGSTSWARCSTTGAIERFTPSPGGTSDIIGYAEADGRVHLAFGYLTENLVLGGSSTPGGATGSVQGNNGSGGLTGYSNVLVGSGFLSIGTNPASAGAVRLANNNFVVSRDSGNANDVFIVGLTGSDLVQLGDASHNVEIFAGTGKSFIAAADTHRLLSGNGGNEFLNVQSSSMTVSSQAVTNTADAKVTFKTIPTNLQTTNATPTTLQSFSVGNTSGIVVVRAIVTASDSSATNTGCWSVDLAYKNVSGTLTQLGTGGITAYGTPSGTLALSASVASQTVTLTATGIAATNVRWTSNGFQDVAVGS